MLCKSTRAGTEMSNPQTQEQSCRSLGTCGDGEVERLMCVAILRQRRRRGEGVCCNRLSRSCSITISQEHPHAPACAQAKVCDRCGSVSHSIIQPVSDVTCAAAVALLSLLQHQDAMAWARMRRVSEVLPPLAWAQEQVPCKIPAAGVSRQALHTGASPGIESVRGANCCQDVSRI